MQAGILTNNFTVTGLTQGVTYAFTVQARNSYGYSDPSLSVSVLAAQLPAVPTTPTTAYQNNGTSIYISWPATDNGGSAITSYTVKIRHNDGTTFTASTTACSGSSQFVLANRACYVPVSVVLAAPYNLPWTSSIFVTVSATNAYGTSADSTAGNGAVIVTVSDPPTNLANTASLTTAY